MRRITEVYYESCLQIILEADHPLNHLYKDQRQAEQHAEAEDNEKAPMFVVLKAELGVRLAPQMKYHVEKVCEAADRNNDVTDE